MIILCVFILTTYTIRVIVPATHKGSINLKLHLFSNIFEDELIDGKHFAPRKTLMCSSRQVYYVILCLRVSMESCKVHIRSTNIFH